MAPSPFVYRVTQYDPRERDADGAYYGVLDSESDHGLVEAAYLAAAFAFAEECGITELTVRDPECHLPVTPDRQPLDESHPLARIFGPGLEGWVDGAKLSIAAAVETLRWMLRGDVWGRLEGRSSFAIHIGYDMYMYICADRPCAHATDAAASLGLFPEPLPASPLDRRADDVDLEARAVDASFWAAVDDLARVHGAVVIVEEAAWVRYWTMRKGGSHPVPRPGSRLAVWPYAPALRSPLRTILMRLEQHFWQYVGSRGRVPLPVEIDQGLVWHGAAPPPDLYEEPTALRGITPGPDGTVSAVWPAWDIES